MDPAPTLEARDELRRLLAALDDELSRPSDRIALGAILRGDRLHDVAREHAMSPSYLNKCAWRVRRRARAWAKRANPDAPPLSGTTPDGKKG